MKGFKKIYIKDDVENEQKSVRKTVNLNACQYFETTEVELDKTELAYLKNKDGVGC